MNPSTQTQHENQTATTHQKTVSGEAVIGFAVFGCLTAGGVGIFRGLNASDGIGSAACLLASVVAFGTVCYTYFYKS